MQDARRTVCVGSKHNIDTCNAPFSGQGTSCGTLYGPAASAPHRKAHARDAGEEDCVKRLRQRQVVGGAERPIAQLGEGEARRAAANPAGARSEVRVEAVGRKVGV